MEKAEKAAVEIRAFTKGNVEVEQLNLASLSSVRECAEKLLNKVEKIDILVNNAGVSCCPQSLTEDGFDMQFGTNHLGHFLLTEMLLPLLRKSSQTGFTPRIVNVSSAMHTWTKELVFDDLHYKNREYSMTKAYAESKLANVMHAKELARRVKDDGIITCSLHPGVVDTEILRHYKVCNYT